MDKIKQLILRLGIRSTYKGFLYLADVGKHYNVNKDNVEHCLRTVVSTCWDKGDRKFLIKISGYNMTQKPTNGEFIDILYHYLTLHEEISL